MHLPQLKSPEVFEKVCRDVIKEIYGISFEQYGRQGQEQHGVDLYGKVDSQNCYIVAQCKNYIKLKNEIFIEQIKRDILAAYEWKGNIKTFVVMTTLSRDTKIQDLIIQNEAPFGIDIFFWESIEEIICHNKNLLQTYYSDLFLHDIPFDIRNKLISYANSIKACIEFLNNRLSYYQPSTDRSEDKKIYMCCVGITNAETALKMYQNEYYLNFEQIEINNYINTLESLISPSYEEKQFDGFINIIATNNEAKLNYSNDKKVKEIFSCCNSIIQRLLSIKNQ